MFQIQIEEAALIAGVTVLLKGLGVLVVLCVAVVVYVYVSDMISDTMILFKAWREKRNGSRTRKSRYDG